MELLLKAIDNNLNSSTILVEFQSPYSKYFEMTSFLMEQLKSNAFHQKLVESDIFRGFDNYVGYDIENEVLQKTAFPGTTYNNQEQLILEEMSEYEFKQLLISISNNDQLTNQFLTHYNREYKEITFYNMQPNFLYVVNEIDNDLNNNKLAFFEKFDKD